MLDLRLGSALRMQRFIASEFCEVDFLGGFHIVQREFRNGSVMGWLYKGLMRALCRFFQGSKRVRVRVFNKGFSVSCGFGDC